MAGDIDRIERELSSLRASVDSLVKTSNSNTQEIVQRLTSTERWQESHDKLDDERYSNLGDMIEAIPVELGKDLGRIELRVVPLESKVGFLASLHEQGKGAALLVKILLGALAALEGAHVFGFLGK